MSRRLSSCVACASIAIAAGCGQAAAPPSYPGPPVCLLGTGVFLFVPIADGDSEPINQGPQGGHHVWGSVLARYLAPDGVTLAFTLQLADTGAAVNQVSFTTNLTPADSSIIAPPPAPADASDSAPDGGEGPSDMASAPPLTRLPGGEEGWGVALGLTVFLPDPGAVDGQRVRLSVVATDGAGRSCSDAHVIVPRQ